MNFSARLSNDNVDVEPGTSVPVEIVVVLSGDAPEQIELSVEGLDGEWYAIPVPAFFVEPGETCTQKIYFKPPREPQSVAGDYPFSVRTRSLDSGESRSISAILRMQPYRSLSMDCQPRKGVVTALKPVDYFVATLVNMGNQPVNCQLFGMDQDDALTFRFTEDHVTLTPGQTLEINFAVHAKSRNWLSSSKLHPVTVQARSLEDAYTSANVQFPVEQKPLFTTATGVFAIFISVLLAIFIALIPKQPEITFNVSPLNAKVGQTVKLSWRALNADGVTINIDGNPFIQNGLPQGNRQYKLLHEGKNYFEAKAYTKTRSTQFVRETVEAEAIPDPEILVFSASQTKVNLGESILFKYKLSPDVIKAVLAPVDKELNLSLNEIAVTPNMEGNEIDFTLLATNEGGKSVKKTIRIRVKKVSRAAITAFNTDVTEISGVGDCILSWDTVGAAKVTLSDGATTQEVPAKDSRQVHVLKTTKFTLIATDPIGLAVRKTIVVKVAEPVTPSTPTPSDNTNGTPPTEPLSEGGKGLN